MRWQWTADEANTRSIRRTAYLHEHMFPPRSIRTAAEALLEVAEALLCPTTDLDAEAALPDADGHPHQLRLRIDRVRRPGAVPTRPQQCVSPLGERTRQLSPRTPAPSRG